MEPISLSFSNNCFRCFPAELHGNCIRAKIGQLALAFLRKRSEFMFNFGVNLFKSYNIGEK